MVFPKATDRGIRNLRIEGAAVVSRKVREDALVSEPGYCNLQVERLDGLVDEDLSATKVVTLMLQDHQYVATGFVSSGDIRERALAIAACNKVVRGAFRAYHDARFEDWECVSLGVIGVIHGYGPVHEPEVRVLKLPSKKVHRLYEKQKVHHSAMGPEALEQFDLAADFTEAFNLVHTCAAGKLHTEHVLCVTPTRYTTPVANTLARNRPAAILDLKSVGNVKIVVPKPLGPPQEALVGETRVPGVAQEETGPGTDDAYAALIKMVRESMAQTKTDQLRGVDDIKSC
eukprot:4926391-Amphidinium_carterae.1